MHISKNRFIVKIWQITRIETIPKFSSVNRIILSLKVHPEFISMPIRRFDYSYVYQRKAVVNALITESFFEDSSLHTKATLRFFDVSTLRF